MPHVGIVCRTRGVGGLTDDLATVPLTDLETVWAEPIAAAGSAWPSLRVARCSHGPHPDGGFRVGLALALRAQPAAA